MHHLHLVLQNVLICSQHLCVPTSSTCYQVTAEHLGQQQKSATASKAYQRVTVLILPKFTTVGVFFAHSTMSSGVELRKAVIKSADMSEEMQADAVDCATQALEKYNIEKDIAAYIKKEFDKKYNPTWHCIVGRNFGSYVTHETKHFIYFYLGQVAILLFKSG